MKHIKTLVFIFIIGLSLGVATVGGLYLYFRAELPSVDILKDVHLQTPLQIFTQDGKLISQYGVKKRIPLRLEEIPRPMVDAILATEDSRFYDHPGIDPIGVMRAAINLIVTGKRSQGASTLTMQLARGFFLTRDREFTRKIKEVFIAWHIEQLLSKDEILELYLNKIELGHRAFGVGAAAQVYYGKALSELSLAQIATIAGLPKAPSTLNPISHPKRSMARRRVVLLRMLDEGFISEAEFHQAANAPVTAARHGAEIELDAPYLANLIYTQMIERYGKEEAETRGFKVFATAPAHLQAAAQAAVKRNLHDYDERHGYRGPIATLWQPLQQDPTLAGTLEGDLITRADDPAWSEAEVLQALDKQGTIDTLIPAVVMETRAREMTVLDKTGTYRVIDWDGLAWARPYISDTKQGPAPEVTTDILHSGQMVYIRQRPEDAQWQLAQFPEATSAMIALDKRNGAIRAVVGGYSFYQSQFNRAIQASRQVGSNIKPLLYSAALHNGYTLASLINDAPINQWDRKSGVAWRPKNSPEVYDGTIRLRRALGRSKNVVSVRLLRAIGLDEAINYMARFGLNPHALPRDESLSLGSASLTPLEVVTGFSVIANGGYLVEPHSIERILDLDGNLVWQANPVSVPQAVPVAPTSLALPGSVDATDQTDADLAPLTAPQVISEQNAFLVSEMLRTAVAGEGSYNKNTYWQGTGWRARNLLKRDDIYGKTGTTNDAKDTWFSGFSNELVATVWVGFDDNSRSLGRTSRNQYLINQNPQQHNYIGNAMVGGEDGARVAQPAWIRFMQVALADKPEQLLPIPTDIVTVRIDRATGKLTPRTDHTSLFEYFIRGTQPTQWIRDNGVDPFADTPTDVDDEIF